MNVSGIESGKGSKWVLVANRAGAKLFSATRSMDQLNLVKSIPHPEGRRQIHEVVSDKHGSRFSSSAGRGNATAHSAGAPGQQQKHGLDPHEDAIEHITNTFAHELSEVLYAGRTHNQFDDLILVAEPHFLGRIKQELDRETASRVLLTIDRNWIDLREDVLKDKLRSAVREQLH